MRRLDGVTHVSLNTVDQEANVFIEDPADIDFVEVAEAADSAAFLVKSIQLHGRGQVLLASCESCASDHNVLEVEGSEQRFHLAGDVSAWEAPRSFSAFVVDWEVDETELRLEP